MREHYDFSKARKNPYAARPMQSVTIRLDEDSIEYFKSMAEEAGIPCQSLISLYLMECAESGRKIDLLWK